MKSKFKQLRKLRRKAKKVGTKPALALVKAVAKKVVADSMEDKYEIRLSQTSGYPRLYDAPITNNDIYQLLPPIVQGTASNQRIGDKIRPKSMRVNFVLTTNNAETSSLIAQVRLLVLQDKSIKSVLALQPITGVQPGSPVGTELLQYGGTLQGFQGLPSDVMARVNRERYSVIKDVQREVIKGAGRGPISANAYTGDQVYVTGQTTHRFTVVVPTPAVLKYSNQTDQFPTNFAPFFVLGYAQPDGNAAGSSLLQRIVLNFETHFDFEDA